jgi:hypothetical protein
MFCGEHSIKTLPRTVAGWVLLTSATNQLIDVRQLDWGMGQSRHKVRRSPSLCLHIDPQREAATAIKWVFHELVTYLFCYLP